MAQGELSPEEAKLMVEALGYAAKGRTLAHEAMAAALREDYEKSKILEQEASENLDASIRCLDQIEIEKLNPDVRESMGQIRERLAKRVVGHWKSITEE